MANEKKLGPGCATYEDCAHWHYCDGCGHAWEHIREPGWGMEKGKAELAKPIAGPKYRDAHHCPGCNKGPIFAWYRGPLAAGFFPMNQA